MFCKWSAREAGRCNLKTYYQLAKHWQMLPPENILLWQIAQALGIKAGAPPAVHTSAPSSSPASVARPPVASSDEAAEAGIAELQQAGFPVFRGPLSADVAAMLEGLPLK